MALSVVVHALNHLGEAGASFQPGDTVKKGRGGGEKPMWHIQTVIS